MEVFININYFFEFGKIYGVFGKNGFGKIMLFRLFVGLIILISGKIFIDNKEFYYDIFFLLSMGIIIENMELFF